jgi:inward rectifier potassium channel
MNFAGLGAKKGIDDTGFGTNAQTEGHRLTNKDGSVNLRKTGLPIWQRLSFYHYFISMKRWRFLASIFLFYTTVNILFACIYLLIGVDHLNGITAAGTGFEQFTTAFFFSSQTLTTVGYGHISPVGLVANIVAALESFIGILSFAMVTGLMYGRFSRPRAFLLFSEHAVVSPFKEGNALMVRLASAKNNHLTDVEAQLILAFHVGEEGKVYTRFFPLTLDIKRISSMAVNWTLVHEIDANSPLWGVSENQLREARAEVMVFIRGFDDTFSNTVQQRTSYQASEIVYGARFVPMFRRSDDMRTTILDLADLGRHEPAPLKESKI